MPVKGTHTILNAHRARAIGLQIPQELHAWVLVITCTPLASVNAYPMIKLQSTHFVCDQLQAIAKLQTMHAMRAGLVW